MCKSNIIFWCVGHPFIYSSYYLLNHRAEFNQYCYITYPHGKGVRKQHFFHPSGVRPTGYHLNHWTESNQTCYMTSPHGKDVEEQVCLSVMLLATLAKFVLMFYGPVNQMGSCRVRSVYFTTHLLGRLSSLSG